MKDLLSELIKRLKDAEYETKEALSLGTHVNNFETYQRLLGNREGLSSALAIIDELLNEDDEDN